ncbi:hypothetical protein BURKHO8Y_120227 [Burkholderia sp. 8Y]|nr:hypothetical protein BURKHO8Y_120227 [Burkholderia sp. 8Y]
MFAGIASAWRMPSGTRLSAVAAPAVCMAARRNSRLFWVVIRVPGEKGKVSVDCVNDRQGERIGGGLRGSRRRRARCIGGRRRYRPVLQFARSRCGGPGILRARAGRGCRSAIDCRVVFAVAAANGCARDYDDARRYVAASFGSLHASSLASVGSCTQRTEA